jgi:cytochrome b6-f complex iron-sulfur subunit
MKLVEMKEPGKDINNNDKTGRRNFLGKIWKILGLVAAGEFTFFTISLLKPGRKNTKSNPGSELKVAGKIEEFPINSVTADRVNMYYLVRNKDGGFIALSLVCSHLGCSVLWDKTKNQFICPCHSSAFDQLGNVINSPAPRALDYFPVIIEEGKVKIDTSQKIKRKKFEKSQAAYAV